METLFLNGDKKNPAVCVATIGTFDGVHLGHRFLLDKVTEMARQSGMKSMAITFDRHPRKSIPAANLPWLLSTPSEKQALLAETGVDLCTVLHFTPEMAALTAHRFMERILRDRLNVRTLITGYDNRFGHNREETFDDYVRYGAALGIKVLRADTFTLNGTNVNSTGIRELISGGDMEMAACSLGYNYRVAGHVVGGMRNGRKMGFPTANIEVSDKGKMIPGNGVYAVRVRIGDNGMARPGMMNIGTRPTFGGGDVSLEVNIFDFYGDIYGKEIEVEFVARIRQECRFASTDRLRAQLAKDKEEALRALDRQP